MTWFFPRLYSSVGAVCNAGEAWRLLGPGADSSHNLVQRDRENRYAVRINYYFFLTETVVEQFSFYHCLFYSLSFSNLAVKMNAKTRFQNIAVARTISYMITLWSHLN